MKKSINKKVQVEIITEGEMGNAHWIIGRWSGAAQDQGWNEGDINAVIAEAKLGDYDHLVSTFRSYSI